MRRASPGFHGLSNQAFYRHFQSKEELLLAVLDQGGRQLDAYLRKRMAAQADPVDKVRAWVRGFAAQAIRRVNDLDWKPAHFLSSTAGSIANTFGPVGLDKCIGIISVTYPKDIKDPAYAHDADVQSYLDFMKKRIPDGAVDDANYSYVAAWEFNGVGRRPLMHEEPLEFAEVHPMLRSYK